MRALTARQLVELVPMRDAVELMKLVFERASAGETQSPLRTTIEMPDGSGLSLYMPAYVPSSEAAPAATGAKIVSVFASNPARGLPTINAIVVMIDPETGVPIGLIEGGALTALRTGAVSGAATDLLACENARVLTVIGAGAQGVTQAAAVAAVRDLKRIIPLDRQTDAVESFAERLAVWDEQAAGKVMTGVSQDEALAMSDIVCTATTSSIPVFDDGQIRSGTHINAVGAFTPQMQEIPTATILRSRIVVDQVEAVLHEAGDFILPIERGELDRAAIRDELGHLVSGSVAGRSDDEQITFFKSVGNAIQDMIVGGLALQRADQRGVGSMVDLL